jgi:hypothetical protein
VNLTVTRKVKMVYKITVKTALIYVLLNGKMTIKKAFLINISVNGKRQISTNYFTIEVKKSIEHIKTQK